MADFDIIRDQTLMFFLDHLIGKGQSRTLHDLSCQFGAKGFTKEMRQIAGGSQAGLRKFLLQFPSLFTIDGENVHLTPLTSNENGTSARDYTKETIEFFTDKLMSYGIAEVPLKSLFGHRSQASSEIRHVSGQNVKEFREFLSTQSNVFVVRDDYVVLQSVLDQLEKDGHNELLRRMPEEITLDPYLMQQLVNELEDKVYCLTENYSNKISIDLLYNAMKSSEQLPALWDDFVKVPTDLNTFLHMNSRIFLVQGNTVSLTNERHIALKDKRTNNDSNHDENKMESNHQFSSQCSSIANVRKASTAAITKDGQQKTAQNANNNNNNNNNRQHHPMSSINTPTSTMTVNQRIRSQIIKIVSQGCNTVDGANRATTTTMDDTMNDACFNDNQYDSIDLQIIKPRVIVKNIDCENIVEDIFKNCSAIAFDVEGINLGVNGEVTLIQIAYQMDNRTNIVLFDVFLNRSLVESGLKTLLESEKIIKVGHDVRNNSANLHKCYGITLRNVFDTQVAHLILQQQTTGRPAYKPTKYISFFTLCNHYGGPNFNPKMKDRLHKLYRKDYKYWKNRPLTDEMKLFSIIEVYGLYPNVFEKMKKQIRPEYEPLFEQLVYESVFACINVDEIKQLKRQRKFELELTDLKLKLFNNEKKKIVLSNREIRLLRYIDLTDEIRNKIEGPLNVAKKLKRFETKKSNGTSNNGTGNNVEHPDRTMNSSDETDESDDDNEDYYEKNQSSSLSPPTSRDYDHSGEYGSSTITTTNNNNMVVETTTCCQCQCHNNDNNYKKFASMNNKSDTVTTNGQTSCHNSKQSPQPSINFNLKDHDKNTRQDLNYDRCDTYTQTLSTGDIVITKIFVNESDCPSQTES